MSGVFGLLGGKLEHSYSPMIHGYLGDYSYELFEVGSDGLDAFMAARRFDGINVTMPHKLSVVPYCADLSEEARAAGSVNTIVRGDDGSLHGHNTDCHGFRAMLEHGGIDPCGKKAAVLGDGGSARAAKAVLGAMGAREIVTITRAGKDNYGNISVHHDAEIIINATPIGMYPDNGGSLVALERFGRLRGVVDLVYNPLRTRLLLDAERLGIPAVGGLYMLVAQAEAASRLFMASMEGSRDGKNRQNLRSPRKAAPSCTPLCHALGGNGEEREKLRAICGAIAKSVQNIAIIGMPGCGKSTVGKALAQRMGRPFADTDAIIEETAGKTVREIFAVEGEAGFRRLETRVLSDICKKSGYVIATGGGAVTQPENYCLLRQNSTIAYLQRDLSELRAEGRPLSIAEGIESLAAKRLPIYEKWSDFTVRSSPDAARTAMMIEERLQ